MASVQREDTSDKMHRDKLLRMHSATAHDWESDKAKKKDFYDDGTMSFFWWVFFLQAPEPTVQNKTP